MRTPLFIACSLFILFSCNSEGTPTEAPDSTSTSRDTIPEPPRLDTVTTLTDLQDTLVIFRDRNGKTYKIKQVEADEEPTAMLEAALDCSNDDFSGSHREAAKVSISSKPLEILSIEEFIETLVDDDSMIAKDISSEPTSNRVKEEKRNVKLENVFLYAIKRESDNDYHIIIGNESRSILLNIENSGLPRANASSFNRLKKVRKDIEDFFGELCKTKYQTFTPGIPITVQGSLFYDVDHRPGIVGPMGFKPKTSWEIHPITKITFE